MNIKYPNDLLVNRNYCLKLLYTVYHYRDLKGV